MNVDVVPKWAREARDHILDLSVKLDSADDYIRKLEATIADLLNALETVIPDLEGNIDGGVDGGASRDWLEDANNRLNAARDAIAKAKGDEL
jgi:hypothetical protein